ncbi:protein of unknown function [Burkholderia multivorans]
MGFPTLGFEHRVRGRRQYYQPENFEAWS